MHALEKLDSDLFRSLSAEASALVYGGGYRLVRTFKQDGQGGWVDGGDDLIEV